MSDNVTNPNFDEHFFLIIQIACQIKPNLQKILIG